MRAVVRVVAALALAVACAAPSATAAPVLVGATLNYSDDVGALLAPISVSVIPGVEICGGAVGPCSTTELSTANILVDGDTIDFGPTSIVFTLNFNAPSAPGDPNGFWFGLDNATFYLSNFLFSPAAELVNLTVSSSVTGLTSTTNVPAGTVSIGLNNAFVMTPGPVTITVDVAARETTQPPPPVPEPTTMLLLGTALVGLVARRRLS